MVELNRFHDVTSKGWNLDVGDVAKVTSIGSVLENLEVSSHVGPKLAWPANNPATTLSSGLMTAYGGTSVQAGSVQEGDDSGSTGGLFDPDAT